MTSLKQTIIEKFLANLEAQGALDERKIEALRKLLAETPKVKADEFVNAFADDQDDVS